MAKKRAGPPPRDDYSGRFPGGREIEGGGEWMEWSTPRQEVIGVYRGTEPFRNGFKTTMVDTDGNIVVFSTPKLLKSKLDGVEIGTRLAIVYTGEGKDTGKGNPLKEFRVIVLDEEA